MHLDTTEALANLVGIYSKQAEEFEHKGDVDSALKSLNGCAQIAEKVGCLYLWKVPVPMLTKRTV